MDPIIPSLDTSLKHKFIGAARSFPAEGGVHLIFYKNLHTLEVPKTEDYGIMLDEMENVFLSNHPKLKSFHEEVINDVPNARVRRYYALPEDLMFVANKA